MEKEQKSTNQPVKEEKNTVGGGSGGSHTSGGGSGGSGEAVKKVEVKPAFLDADVQAAVNAAIGAVVPELLKALAPQAVNPSVPVVQPNSITTMMNPNPPQPAVAYKTKLKGIPVHPGMDLRHVHPQEIKNWFARLENRWKENYAKKQAAALGSSVSLTMEAGTPFPFTPH